MTPDELLGALRLAALTVYEIFDALCIVGLILVAVYSVSFWIAVVGVWLLS